MAKNVTQTIQPSHEQDAIRRANKAKRRHGKGFTPASDSFLAGLQRDREIERQTAKAARQLDQYEQRCDQANKAREDEGFKKLTPGTVAYQVAAVMLEQFPAAEPTVEDGRQLSRTTVAYREAVNTLRGDDVLRTGAISYGNSVARRALHWAFVEQHA